VPPSITRVGTQEVFPNEYPGQNYLFNWSLNKDGVTPINKSAFRITKPLDLKIAGLEQPKTKPLKVKPAPASKMPEAGSSSLSFDLFDEKSQTIKNALTKSPHLYCPEGHAPSTRTGVRVITNSATLAPDMLAYLERMPRKDEPTSQPVTVYAFEGEEEAFASFAIEEVEDSDSHTGEMMDPKSVAAVVVTGAKLDIKTIVCGIELSVAALAADAEERAAAAAADAAAGE
jgi:hypothetical protein